MADLRLIICEDGEGYYLADGDDNETAEAANWGECLEFKGVRYLGETDGANATLSIVTAVAAGEYETEEEGDDDEDEDEEEGVASAAD